MKKISSLLACIMVIAAMSGCNNSNKPANSDTSTSVTEAPPTSATTTSAATSAPASSDSGLNVTYMDETEPDKEKYVFLDERVEAFKDSAPHFYDFATYFNKAKATISFDQLDADFRTELSTVLYIDTDIGLRVLGNTGKTGTDEDIIDQMIYYNHHFIISHTAKKVFDADLYAMTVISLNESIRKTHLGYNFDADEAIKVETGEEEIAGVTYGMEKLSGTSHTTAYYYDKETGRVTYIRTDNALIRINDYTDTVPRDALTVSQDYEVVTVTD